jgi:hypothetical protein
VKKESVVFHRVLGISRQGGLLPDLDPVLESLNSELYVAPDLLLGLEMIRSLGRVDLVLVEHPLEELTLKEFQAEVRRSSTIPLTVAVLVRAEEVESVDGSDETDLILLQFEESVEEALGPLSKLLTRAHRVAARLMVRLEIGSGREKLLRVAQTENISKTGMLLRTRQQVPENALIGFEFYIPDDSHPIRGTASVVRTVQARDDTNHGIAIHFQDLLHSDEQRLETFLASQASDADAESSG